MSSKNKIIGVGVFLIAIMILSIVYLCLPKIDIDIKGEKNVNILLGDIYEEAGATANIKYLFSKKEFYI